MAKNVIAFVGAGCAGKTTLFEKCRSILGDNPDVAFVNEAARRFFLAHPMAEELRFTVDVQSRIQTLALREQAAASRQAKLVIADRSGFDAPVYVSATGDTAGAQKLLRRAWPSLAMYRQLFLLDVHDISFEQDAVRQEDRLARQRIHDEFASFLTRHHVPFTVLSGTVDERYDAVSTAFHAPVS